MLISKEMLLRFNNIFEYKVEYEEKRKGGYSTLCKSIEMGKLNDYILDMGFEGEDVLDIISEYNDIFYFKNHDPSKRLTASQKMDMVDGYIYDENLKTILGVASKQEPHHLKLTKKDTLEKQMDYQIEKLNFISKAYSDWNTFSKEDDFEKTNYRILSNKITPDQLEDDGLAYILYSLKCLESNYYFKDVTPEKLFLMINKDDFYNLSVNRKQIPSANLSFKTELTKYDYENNDYLIISQANRTHFFKFLKGLDRELLAEDIFINFALRFIKNNQGFLSYIKNGCIDSKFKLSTTVNGFIFCDMLFNSYMNDMKQNVSETFDSSVHKIEAANVSTLVKIHKYEKNNNRDLDSLLYKEFLSAIREKVINKDQYLYKIKSSSKLSTLVKFIFRQKRSLITIEKKSAQMVLESKEYDPDFSLDFLGNLKTIGDIDELLMVFNSDRKSYKKEIEILFKIVNFNNSFTVKELNKLRSFFKNKLSENSFDMLMIKFEDSGNKNYNALINKSTDINDKYVSNLYFNLENLMTFIEDLNLYIEEDLNNVDVIIELNKLEMLRF